MFQTSRFEDNVLDASAGDYGNIMYEGCSLTIDEGWPGHLGLPCASRLLPEAEE